MTIIYDIVLLVIGLLLVCKGGDYFVDSSVDIARALGIPRIVIGGTIVSIATTTPELTVSAMASWMGDSGIAIGNAVGSAIANIGLIVGCVACITPVSVDEGDFRRRSYWMIVSAILVVVFSWTRYLNPLLGAVLLLISAAYLFVDYWNIRQRKLNRTEGETQDPETERVSTKSIVMFAIGIAMVIFGSRLLVTSGVSLATALGIPSVIIGLSIVAVGTSLPELVTGVTAARKGVPDLSIGNIVGANVLNLALIIGASSLIHPLSLSYFTQWYSFPWLFIFVTAMVLMFRGGNLVGKKGGVALLILYALYILGLVVIPSVMDI
ncbi:MAG: calcium/sodium antiporter [Deltaproteobacteria bacterium]|nr:calcium/sodium antiporter [Deltaproteobacteria bacterium]